MHKEAVSLDPYLTVALNLDSLALLLGEWLEETHDLVHQADGRKGRYIDLNSSRIGSGHREERVYGCGESCSFLQHAPDDVSVSLLRPLML